MSLRKYILQEYVNVKQSEEFKKGKGQEFRWYLSKPDAIYIEEIIRDGIRKELDTNPKTEFRLYYGTSSAYFRITLEVNNKNINQVVRISNHKYSGESETTSYIDEIPTFFINGWESREYIVDKLKEFTNRTINYYELKYRESQGKELTTEQRRLIVEAEDNTDKETYFSGRKYSQFQNKFVERKQFPPKLNIETYMI